ncbi:MAG: helix-turn-helix domain-containing protein [Bacilli bacterium]
MIIAQRLRFFRKKAGLTMLNVADHLDVNYRTYSNYEEGYTMPKADQIKELCLLFNCSPSQLLGLDVDEYGVSESAWTVDYGDGLNINLNELLQDGYKLSVDMANMKELNVIHNGRNISKNALSHLSKFLMKTVE